MNPLLSHYNSKYIVWTLTALIAVGFIMYAVFVNFAIINVAERVELEKSVVVLQAETNHLEFKSIALAQKIDLEEAYGLGFEETDSPHYVVRGGSGAFALRDTSR